MKPETLSSIKLITFWQTDHDWESDITTDYRNSRMIMREYHEQLFANKGEMDKFLEGHKLPECIQEEIT